MFTELMKESVFAGVFISLGAYFTGAALKKRFKLAIFNPILIGIILTVCFLLLTDIPYSVYNESAKYLSYLLTPATICLAIPLYEQIEQLKKNPKAIMAGIITGVLTSMLSVLALAAVFKFDHAAYVTFLPKSVTSAIGMGISAELGGYTAITVAVIIISGIIGNMIAEPLLKALKITEPVAKGIAIGSASHAVGTAKALEIGPVEGAMSSLSIVVSGVITVFAAVLFAGLY